MPHLPAEIILVLAPFAPLFSGRVWLHAQVWLLGAMLAPEARTTPVLLALCSLVTVLALKLSQGEQIPVPVTAWYHKGEPTFADCLALVRGHLWRARYVVTSAPQAEFVQIPPEVLDLLIHGVPLAA